MILMIYNEKMCREILLPNQFDTDFMLELFRETYQLHADLLLHFENVQNAWFLQAEKNYQIKAGKDMVDRWKLKDRTLLEINSTAGDRVFLVACDEPIACRVMEKYDLSGMREVSIGAKDGNVIQYQFFGLVSGQHGRLVQRGSEWVFEDTSTNGAFLRGQRIRNSIALHHGDRVDVFGMHMVFLYPYLLVGANCGELKVDETVLPEIAMPGKGSQDVRVRKSHEENFFNRSPRDIPVIQKETIEIEAPPAPKHEKKKPVYLTIGPAFTMAIPMLMGCLMMIFASRMSGRSNSTFMYTGLVIAAGSALVGTIWALLNLKYSEESAAEDETLRFNAYSNYLVGIAENLRKLYQQNKNAMNQMYPSASECIAYDRTSTLLWNRNPSHKDFLYIRIGLGDYPFQVEIKTPKEKFSLINDTLSDRPGEIKQEFQTLHKVPVGISLMQHPLIGIVGRSGAVDLMHVLTAGIAAAHSYTDVKLVYFYDESDHSSLSAWECMRWFPHVWSEDKSMRFMAANETERRDVIFHLTNVIRTRAEQSRERGKAVRYVHPHYVIFVQNPSLLEGELLTKYLYDANPAYGLSVVLLAESMGQLPNVCEMILENSRSAQRIYNLQDEDGSGRQDFVPDQVSYYELESFGRTLSNIRVKEMEVTSEIPSSLGFLEMYGARTLSDLYVQERWLKNRTYDSMRALIGRKAGNQDCYLDIHEKFHGPHGLVAGTTGSGKSETLQTYILSLAVNFSPEDVSFFIIDFKGGGMANLFSGLPHLAGQISNLSGNQVNRAMVSIKSENVRRQRIFAENGVNNINLYTKLYKDRRAKEPIPHLFIIIDEFAELKREEPDFMQELISVAQVGRSLGVHLILATQKPGGTVDDNIQSNSKFRLCLRVQDKQDSTEMLHRPDAAYLTQAGRCYLQVGNDEIFELFQSGYSGALYIEDGGRESAAALLGRTGRTELTGSINVPEPVRGNGISEQTELEAVIDWLRNEARENGYRQAPQLWLPVLGTRILLQDLHQESRYQDGCWPESEGKWDLSVVLGLSDDPERQQQKPFVFSFADGGHMAICGNVVSGKSVFLQTMVYELITRYSPQQVQLYLLDFSSHMLAPFASAPHVGGVVTDQQEEKLAKFFFLLNRMMDERRKLLQGGNYAQYIQAHGMEVPAIVIVLDNYVAFREKSADKYEKEIQRLIREGVGYGMYFAVSATGFGMSEIPVRIADQIRTVISLEQPDKYKYLEVLRIAHLPVMPETNVKGRGLAFAGDRLLEFQTALCLDAEDDFSRGQKLEALAEEMDQHWNGIRPAVIPEIPENPTLSLLQQDTRYQAAIKERNLLPIGYREQDAEIQSICLPDNYCLAITGKSRSGKTNILRMLMYSAARKEGRVVVIEEKKGDFAELERDAKALQAEYVTDSEGLYAFFTELLPEFAARNKKKQQLLKDGYDEEALAEEMSKEPPVFIFLADLGSFFNMVYLPGEGIGGMSGFVENIMEKGRLHNIYFIGCLKPEDHALLLSYKAYHSFIARKQGIHAGGNLAAQKIFQFQNIPFSEQSKGKKKGYVYVSDDKEEGTGIEAVIPLVR